MKTKITFFILLFAAGFSVNAQIPNASFENWTGSEPNGWFTENSVAGGSTTQSTSAHSGSKAVKLNAVSAFGSYFGGLVIAGNMTQTGFPQSTAPAALHGWYKFQSTSNTENVGVYSGAQYQGTAVGGAILVITANTSVYTEFISNFYYPGSMVVDTASISIVLSASDSLRPGTNVTIDDLSFGPASTGIQEATNVNTLEPCSPNPASHVANIIYRIRDRGMVSLAVYDLTGRRVMSLLDELDQTSGRYKVPADVSILPEGVYFYKLTVNGQSFTQRLVVSR